MAVCLAGLSAARLSEIGCDAAFAEGNKRLDVCAHGCGEANEDFEVGLDAGVICGLPDQLHIAEGVGDGAGLLVKARRGKDDVGDGSGFGQEKVLHDDEGVGECLRVDATALDTDSRRQPQARRVGRRWQRRAFRAVSCRVCGGMPGYS